MLPGGILTPGESSGVPENVAVTYLNGDGDILVDTCNLGNITDKLSGSATVSITMPMTFSDIKYDFCAVFKYSASGSKIYNTTIRKTTENAITFTDNDVSKHDYFIIRIVRGSRQITKELWDTGIRPESIKFTLSDGTVKEYEIQVLE